MTNEQEKAKELAKLLNAFSEVKQLECTLGGTNNWQLYDGDVSTILVDMCSGWKFRIKPETKRIALTMQDLIDRELSGKTMRVKHGIACMLIQDFNDELVFFSDDEFSYEQLTSLEWIDGTPCYKEVECE